MGHLVRLLVSSRHIAATAGARAGISNMHDELNLTKPGEPMSKADVKAATNSPLMRRQTKKIAVSRTAVNTDVTNRGPRIEGDTCFRICVMSNVCNGGWSF